MWPAFAARPWAASAPPADCRLAARLRRPVRAAAARLRCPVAHSAELLTCPAAAPAAATGCCPARGCPAPAADDWVSAAGDPAAVPALPLRRRAVADCHRGEYCRADAAPVRKIYCRSARAQAAQARSWWRQQRPQYSSGQWFETSRGFTGESGSRHSIDLSADRRGPVNTPNTAGKGPFTAGSGHWPAPATDEIVAPMNVRGALRRTVRNPETTGTAEET